MKRRNTEFGIIWESRWFKSFKTKLSFFFFLVLTFSACKTEPKDSDIKDQIHQYYMKMSTAAGGGSWHVSEVQIIEKKRDTKQKGVWEVKAITDGIYESPPLGNPVPDKNFSDTIQFHFKKNENDIWLCTELYP